MNAHDDPRATSAAHTRAIPDILRREDYNRIVLKNSTVGCDNSDTPLPVRRQPMIKLFLRPLALGAALRSVAVAIEYAAQAAPAGVPQPDVVI